jgi:hypothetical protein
LTEERGSYDLHVEDPDRDLGGVERVGDVLRQLIDERGWPLATGPARANGARSGGDDEGRYPDA